MRLLIRFVLAIVPIGGLLAQSFFGSIVGSVNDGTGAGIPLAGISLVNTGTSDRRTSQTDGSGNYQFINLTPGQYRVEVEKTGFRRFVRANVAVEVQSMVRIDVAMQVGDVSQTLEVTAQTPLLETENAALGHVVESRKVLEMPLNGRNVFALVALVPGVVPGGQSGGSPTGANPFAWGNFQIGGGQANQSASFIDGAPVNAG